MEKSKIETYLGFCIRSRSIIFGAETIEKQKKGVFLLVIDGGIGKNSLKPMLRAQEKLGCPLYITDEGALAQWVHRPAVKAVAITDNNLASAMIKCAEGEPKFKLYSGGNN
ncbi:MAG: hypothetical protein IKD15_02565 [Clostridia bacterium]|nr:hypothetical protein [Clostridia bacterium]